MARTVRLGPLIFFLVGAGAGLSLGMVTQKEPPFQVHLEDSVPRVATCGLVGLLFGIGIREVCTSWPRLIRPAGLLSVALLSATIMAPLGWIVGTMEANERLPRADVKEDVQHLPPLGLTIGACVGCVAGLALGWFHDLRERRRPSIEPGQGSAAEPPAPVEPQN